MPIGGDRRTDLVAKGNTLSGQLPVSDPANWWRRLCFPTRKLAISGDLDIRSDISAARQLAEWAAAGITDIVDARDEWSDVELVARLAPAMRYHWVGTDDDGCSQSDEWFDEGVAAALGAVASPNRKVLIHCHMGVNRGPSLAFATMLALGHDPINALSTIRRSRPIAAVLYAPDALHWWHRRFGDVEPIRDLDVELAAIDAWMIEHPVDSGWVISRIRRAEAA